MPIAFIVAAALVATAPPQDSTRLLRFPDICGDAIAFVYGGDIYSVPSGGGIAQRLTSHAGNELYPKFSPDCATIAFSAEYDGTRQVYLIQAAGGTPRQITWYNDVGPLSPRRGTDYRVLDFTPDGRHVLVRVNRAPYSSTGGNVVGAPYLVPVDGGLEKPLPMQDAGGGMFSPDGTSLVYTPLDHDFRSWKRYRGGLAPDVWTYDLVHNTARRLTDHRATDQQPMWLGDTIYFVSDRDDEHLNLWAMGTDGADPRKVTRFDDFDVLWPSAGRDAIVFEQGGWIWRFDAKTQQAQKVDIRVTGDLPQALPQWKKVAANVESFGLSPHGERAVLAARGELFTVPAQHGEIRNVSRTPAAREISASWSPDGRWIAYLSDASGEYEIYLRAQDGSGEPRRLTHDGDTWRFTPVWSPDSRKLAYGDKHQRLRILDIASGRQTDVDRSHDEDMLEDNDITQYAWSPDSAWLAYARTNAARLRQIWLYSLASGKKTAVTEPTMPAFSPTFDPQGRWLYFLSNRDWNLTFSAYEVNYLYTNATRPYAMTLAKDGPLLYPLPSDEVAPAAPKIADAGKPSGMRVDLDGIERRVAALNVAAGSYQSLSATIDALYYLAGDRYGAAFELRRLALDAAGDAPVAQGVSDYRLSSAGDKLVLRQGDAFAIVDAKADADPKAGALDLARLELRIDPREEWPQLYADAWRTLRDWFYDPGMHGGIERWKGVRERYAALLPYVATRSDLDYLLHEIAGENNAGHVYVESPPDVSTVERHPGGLLGATFAADASGYFRFAKVYEGQNWSDETRSPLTAQGVDVRAGDWLVAVDGVDVRSVKHPLALLQGKGGQVVRLAVNTKPDAAGAREVRVKTLTSEASLRYLDWVNARRTLVDRLSNGRIGYIHVPNTAQWGNRELNRGLVAYHYKEALIVDDRYNGGGFIPDRMIELLARRPLNYWKRRELEPSPMPMLVHDGPKAMLINGPAGSGGDAFPYYFRKAKLGPLIGTRTWGGLIGVSGNPLLADGGSMIAATYRIMSTDGAWVVEDEGVVPDIEVIDRPDLVAAGRDPSVEKAVEVLLGQLPATPRAPVKAPPAPEQFGDQGGR